MKGMWYPGPADLVTGRMPRSLVAANSVHSEGSTRQRNNYSFTHLLPTDFNKFSHLKCKVVNN